MVNKSLQLLMKLGVVLLLPCCLAGCRQGVGFSDVVSQSLDTVSVGSSIPLSTDPIRKEHYRSWPKDIRAAVDKHILLVGMDKLQVQVSLEILESALSKQVATTTNAVLETWTVWHYPGGWSATKAGKTEIAIVFKDGLVSAIRRIQFEEPARPARKKPTPRAAPPHTRPASKPQTW